MKVPRGRRVGQTRSPDELTCHATITDLEEQLQQEEEHNRKLRLRHDIILGLCIGAGLAVRTLRQLLQAKDRQFTETNGPASRELPAPWELELAQSDYDIECILTQSPNVALLLASSVPELPPSLPGSSRSLLYRVLNDELLADDPLFASILDGSPMSFLIALSVCMVCDPDVVRTVNQQYKERSDLHNEHCSMQVALKPLLCQYDAAADADSRNAIVREIAIVILASSIMQLATRTVKPEVVYGSDTRQANLAPAALLDALTEKIELKPDQLQGTLEGLQVFHDLQAPFAKQKADISKRMTELLQAHTSAIQPRSASLATIHSNPAQAAAVAGRAASEPLLEGPVPGACRLLSLGLAEGIEGKMQLLGLTDHDTLAALTDQLAKVSAKTTWLDGCSFGYAMGQLTWLQVGDSGCWWGPWWAQ